MTGTLYGKLIADSVADHNHYTSVLHDQSDLINHFGEAIQPFKLTPHVRASKLGGIALVALSNRGDDSAALVAALTAAGFRIGEPVKTLTQFRDGFAIWTAPAVAPNNVEFTLVYYIDEIQ